MFSVGRCPPVPTVLNATPDSTLTLNGSIVNYICNRGYQYDPRNKSSATSRRNDYRSNLENTQNVTNTVLETVAVCDGHEWKLLTTPCKGNIA